MGIVGKYNPQSLSITRTEQKINAWVDRTDRMCNKMNNKCRVWISAMQCFPEEKLKKCERDERRPTYDENQNYDNTKFQHGIVSLLAEFSRVFALVMPREFLVFQAKNDGGVQTCNH